MSSGDWVAAIFFFFFNDTATTEIYTLSLHDALPIFPAGGHLGRARLPGRAARRHQRRGDRKSTRLNSSHANISYAVFCLKKKTTTPLRLQRRFRGLVAVDTARAGRDAGTLVEEDIAH